MKLFKSKVFLNSLFYWLFIGSHALIPFYLALAVWGAAIGKPRVAIVEILAALTWYGYWKMYQMLEPKPRLYAGFRFSAG